MLIELATGRRQAPQIQPFARRNAYPESGSHLDPKVIACYLRDATATGGEHGISSRSTRPALLSSAHLSAHRLSDDAGMTDALHNEAIIAVIAHGVEVARQNPMDQDPPITDDYIAWCVINQLRLAGWSVVPST